MPRPRLSIGTFGDISTRVVASGRYEARTRYRDWDGQVRRIAATAATARAAEHELKAKIAERTAFQSGDTCHLTPDSAFGDLVEYWLEDIDLEDRISKTTRMLYERNMRTLVMPTHWMERERQSEANAADQARVTNAYKALRGLEQTAVPAVAAPNPCVNNGTCRFTPDVSSLREMAHGALDVVGLVPGVGEAADGLNGLWYVAEGDYLSAGLSFGGMVPLLGWGSTLGKGAKVLAAPTTASRGADNVASGARLRAQLAGEEIAGGHSYVKHVVERGEYPHVRTRDQFAILIEDVIANGEITETLH